MGKKQKQLQSLLKEVVGDLTSQDLLKTVVDTALNGELDEHLGYGKHDPSGYGTDTRRNGY